MLVIELLNTDNLLVNVCCLASCNSIGCSVCEVCSAAWGGRRTTAATAMHSTPESSREWYSYSLFSVCLCVCMCIYLWVRERERCLLGEVRLDQQYGTASWMNSADGNFHRYHLINSCLSRDLAKFFAKVSSYRWYLILCITPSRCETWFARDLPICLKCIPPPHCSSYMHTCTRTHKYMHTYERPKTDYTASQTRWRSGR